MIPRLRCYDVLIAGLLLFSGLACSNDMLASQQNLAPIIGVDVSIFNPPDVILPGQRLRLRTFAVDSLFNVIYGVVPDSIINTFPDVARLEGDSVIVTLKPGHALFTGWLQGQKHPFGFDVNQPVTHLALLDDTAAVQTLTVVPNGVVYIAAVLTFANDSSGRNARPIDWSLSDSSMATLIKFSDANSPHDADETVAVGSKQGSFTITATREGVSATVLINVVPMRYTQVSAGVTHACALATTGEAWCWGAAGSNGDAAPRLIAYSSLTPAPIPGNMHFVTIATGDLHSCALTASGQAWCWGDNTHGQLGDGTRTSSSIPVAVMQGGVTFASLVAGTSTSCGITVAGDAYCWGGGPIGSPSDSSLTPLPVSGGHKFTSVVLTEVPRFFGVDHGCGLDVSGSAWCWGADNTNQLGDNPPGADTGFGGFSATPVHVNTDSTFKQLALYGGGTSCGLTTGGTLLCWGDNPTFATPSVTVWFTPTIFPTLSSPQDVVVAGGSNMCGLRSAVLTCAAVYQSFGATPYLSLTIGDSFGCALRADGITVCWGANGKGQLGNPIAGSGTPVAVVGQ